MTYTTVPPAQAGGVVRMNQNNPKGPAMGSYKESRVSWVLPAKTWQKPTEVQP